MPTEWERVAETVKRRRTALGLSQRTAATLAGFSPTTWSSLETHAHRVDDLTRPKFCRALRWTSDSIDLMLRGEQPQEDNTPLPPSTEDRVAALEAGLSSIEDRLDRIEEMLTKRTGSSRAR